MTCMHILLIGSEGVNHPSHLTPIRGLRSTNIAEAD